MVDWIIDSLKWVWGWVMDVGSAAGQAIWSGVMTGIPSFDNPALDEWASYLVAVNHWLPIDALLAAWVTYFTFLAIFVSVKIVLKLVPFIG